MAAIKITALSTAVPTTSAYVYKDIQLDLIESTAKSDRSDLVANYDYNAVRQSLSNLFNTNPGERILTPNFGLNLKKYLFLPVIKHNAIMLGDEIKTGIMQWEPRVSVTSIIIVTDAANNAYQVNISLTINTLSSTAPTTMPGILSNSGFQFIV